MTNVAGKTVLQVGVDGAQAEAGIDGIKESVKELNTEVSKASQSSSKSFKVMGQSSDDAGNRITASGKRTLKSLEQQANRLELTTAEYAKLRAETAGVGNAAAPFVARIAAATAATANMGMSAKATAAAMRGVPAQITDIVVGLQGGQAPLTVLLQQGGQLKDMFGGVAPAAKALGSSIMGLVNPYTVAATAAAAFGYAVYSGSEENGKFNKSLITSGNVIGTTSAELSRLATSVGDVSGSRGKAVEALDQLAGGGRVAGENIAALASAAVEMNRTVGKEISDTVGEFESLADKPADSLAKLNEKYNFLTLSVYDQVRALEKQGQTQQAVALAQTTLAEAFQKQASLVNQNLGIIERSWRAVSGAASTAWEAMKGVGRAETVEDLQTKIRASSERLRSLQDAGGFASNGAGAAFGGARGTSAGAQNQVAAERSRLSAEIQMLEQQRTQATLKGILARTEAEKIAARERTQLLDREVESNAKKRAREIEQVRRDAKLLGESERTVDDRIKAINEKYKDPKVAASKAYRDDAATTMLMRLKEQEASLRAQSESDKKLTTAAQERAKFEQQIAEIKEKKVLTADQKSLLANQDAIRVQLDKNVAVANEVKSREALIKLEERSAQIQASIASSQTSRQEQYDRTLTSFGLGDRAQARVQSESSIRREYQRYQDQLNKSAQDGLLGTDQYKSASSSVSQAQEAALEAQRRFYANEDELRGSWELGYQNAFQNYVDSAKDAYNQAGYLFQSVTGGMEDALVQFATNGKISFRSLADSIIADLVRISSRQAIVGAIGSITGAFSAGASASSLSAASAIQSGGGDGIGALISMNGWAGGGHTGSGRDTDIAGLVHRNEYVFDADATRRLGVNNLERLSKGLGSPGLSASPASSQAASPVSVHNYGGRDVDVQRMSDGEILVEIDKRISRQTPQIMAREQRNPNSRLSKAQSEATTTQRNRR
ncbi:phage tail tape measure protein [Alcaligenaceae bacterium B3P038]|nr:phage tail tape measure protein [Alcaligenaceae bacterium B3P038]